MILEKNFEDIVAKYPELIEDGLILTGRQVSIYGRRMDLLFEDKFRRKLIVELKVGPIKDAHIGQVLSYEGMLLSNEDPTIRVMLIGNRVPPNIQRSLDHHGIAWREITLNSLKEFLNTKNDLAYLELFASMDLESLAITGERKLEKKVLKTSGKTNKNPNGKRVTKKSVCLEFISRNGGGSINDMARAIVERGIDPDFEKNVRVCRLWMSKIGFPVKKLENGNYIKSALL